MDVKCPECGFQGNEDAKYCRECGAPLRSGVLDRRIEGDDDLDVEPADGPLLRSYEESGELTLVAVADLRREIRYGVFQGLLLFIGILLAAEVAIALIVFAIVGLSVVSSR